MEADWTIALGADDPVIAVPWDAGGNESGQCRFLDLRAEPHLVDEIREVKHRPGLRSALQLLNGELSQFWTAKCDAWVGSGDEREEPFDPYEMDAEPDEITCGAGSYVDLVPRDPAVFSCFERQEAWLRTMTVGLRAIPAKAVRVEMVMRHAQVKGKPGFAMTWFVEGCGATLPTAIQRWDTALLLALTVMTDVRFDSLVASDTMGTPGE